MPWLVSATDPTVELSYGVEPTDRFTVGLGARA